MASIKENLIKLTDYPFTYSVLGSIIIMGYQTNVTPVNISHGEYVPILILVGIIGTILSIIDPFGRLAKYIIIIAEKNRFEESMSSHNQFLDSKENQERFKKTQLWLRWQL